jgi:DNA-binding transcriptional LysR family regulator
MELRLLRYFVVVGQELHFGRAAALLHISTPTLSRQIQHLEREIGAPLLVRNSRCVELTPAGAVLLDEGRRTLRAAADAVRETRLAAGLADPVLRLGLLNGVPESVPLGIERLAEEHFPGCRIILTGGTTTEQLGLLARDDVDLALVRTPVRLPAGLRQAVVGTEPLGLLMAEGHPLAESAELALTQLAGVEVILFPRDRAPDFYDVLLGHLGDIVVSESATPHAQLRSALLVRRDAVSLGSARAAQPGIAWRPLAGEPIVVTFAAVWRAASRHPVLREVVSHLQR